MYGALYGTYFYDEKHENLNPNFITFPFSDFVRFFICYLMISNLNYFTKTISVAIL
jgi:hypothetical protein